MVSLYCKTRRPVLVLSTNSNRTSNFENILCPRYNKRIFFFFFLFLSFCTCQNILCVDSKMALETGLFLKLLWTCWERCQCKLQMYNTVPQVFLFKFCWFFFSKGSHILPNSVYKQERNHNPVEQRFSTGSQRAKSGSHMHFIWPANSCQIFFFFKCWQHFSIFKFAPLLQTVENPCHRVYTHVDKRNVLTHAKWLRDHIDITANMKLYKLNIVHIQFLTCDFLLPLYKIPDQQEEQWQFYSKKLS